MRTLHNIFKRRREIERMEALSEMFRYSRAEDIAKVFELGRIHALRQLKTQLYIGLGTIALAVTIGGYFLVQDYLQLKVNYIVESKVEKEIDKRIDKFSNFYSYVKDVIPIMEYEFYRIKKFDVLIFVEDIEGNSYPSISAYSEMFSAAKTNNSHHIEFKFNKYDNFGILYSYWLIDELDKTIEYEGQPIDIISKYYLILDQNLTKDRIPNFIKEINFILKVNDIEFPKVPIPKEEFKTESITDEPDQGKKHFPIKIHLGKYFKNAEEVRKIYREKLSVQLGIQRE